MQIPSEQQDYNVLDEENGDGADQPVATPEQAAETDDPGLLFPDEQDTRHVQEIPTEDLVGDEDTGEIDDADGLQRRSDELRASGRT